MGTITHTYSQLTNSNHFSNIIDDFSNERYVSGSFKIITPYIVSLTVLFYSKKQVRSQYETKMNDLEVKLDDAEL